MPKSLPMADLGANKREKLSFLAADPARQARPGKFYSWFVRFLRLVLPLIAVSIMAVLFMWPHFEEMAQPQSISATMPQTASKNELLNPRFESRDKKDQPFTVTAARALQSTRDPEVILLEKPMADIILSDGTWLAAEAQNGAYRQNAEKLLLEGKVKLFHDQGYEMHTEKILVDLASRKAWSDLPVYGQGPAGTIEATGMHVDTKKGKLIFTGPAKLVLNRTVEGL